MGCTSSKGTKEDGSGPRDRNAGSVMNVTKQSDGGLTVTEVLIVAKVLPGLKSEEVCIRFAEDIHPPIEPTDESNSYLFDREKQPIEFDAAQTFANVTTIKSMYSQANPKKSLGWQWSDGPIRIYCRAGEMPNTFYVRDFKALAFCYFQDPSDAEKTVYTCRFFDLVAHQIGHAITDTAKPAWFNGQKPHALAIHEAFANLTTIVALLYNNDVCEQAVIKSRGDLRKMALFLAELVEQSGESIGRTFSLKNFDEDPKISEVTEEPYELAAVLTRAVYEIIFEMYETDRDEQKENWATTLSNVGRKITSILISAVIASPDDPTVDIFAQKMMNAEKTTKYKTIMKQAFEKREINKTVKPKPVEVAEGESTPAVPHKICCASLAILSDDAIFDQLSKHLQISEEDIKFAKDNRETLKNARKAAAAKEAEKEAEKNSKNKKSEDKDKEKKEDEEKEEKEKGEDEKEKEKNDEEKETDEKKDENDEKNGSIIKETVTTEHKSPLFDDINCTESIVTSKTIETRQITTEISGERVTAEKVTEKNTITEDGVKTVTETVNETKVVEQL